MPSGRVVLAVRVEHRLTREDVVEVLAFDAYRHGIPVRRLSASSVRERVRHLLGLYGDAGLEGWADGADQEAVETAFQWAEVEAAAVLGTTH